ncbi:hypothetical protein [Desulfobacter sp.]|uniref:hypothetical protein n=1 Tax=Desulfobacter sp. TaxID=2294 RepID=UPI003D12861A
MSDASVNPSNVVINNPITSIGSQKIPNAPEKVFALQISELGKIQFFVAQVQHLGITTFSEQYGDFQDKALVDKATVLFKNLQEAAGQFGSDSRDIMKTIGTENPPNDPFAYIIWTASKIESIAMNISNFMGSGLPAISQEKDPAKRAENLKQLLTYEGAGVYSYLAALKNYSEGLNKALSLYFSDKLKPAGHAFGEYFAPVTVLSVAEESVSALSGPSRIQRMGMNNVKLVMSTYDWCIGGSKGQLNLSALPPLFPVSAPAFDVDIAERTKLLKEIGDDNAVIKKLGADEQKKSALVAQVGGMLGQSAIVHNSTHTLLKAAIDMAEGFSKCAADVLAISNAITPEKMKDLAVFMANTGLDTAKDAWAEIQTTANAFINCAQMM